jgi:hypothetical protein
MWFYKKNKKLYFSHINRQMKFYDFYFLKWITLKKKKKNYLTIYYVN